MGLEWAFSGASRSQRRIRGETRKWRERCGSSGKAPLRPSKKNLPLRARRKAAEDAERIQKTTSKGLPNSCESSKAPAAISAGFIGVLSGSRFALGGKRKARWRSTQS